MGSRSIGLGGRRWVWPSSKPKLKAAVLRIMDTVPEVGPESWTAAGMCLALTHYHSGGTARQRMAVNEVLDEIKKEKIKHA